MCTSGNKKTGARDIARSSCVFVTEFLLISNPSSLCKKKKTKQKQEGGGGEEREKKCGNLVKRHDDKSSVKESRVAWVLATRNRNIRVSLTYAGIGSASGRTRPNEV